MDPSCDEPRSLMDMDDRVLMCILSYLNHPGALRLASRALRARVDALLPHSAAFSPLPAAGLPFAAVRSLARRLPFPDCISFSGIGIGNQLELGSRLSHLPRGAWPAVRTTRLSGTALSPRLAEQLPRCCPNVESLEITYAGACGLLPLARALVPVAELVTSLEVARVPLCQPAAAGEVAASLRGLTRLRRLVWRGSRLTERWDNGGSGSGSGADSGVEAAAALRWSCERWDAAFGALQSAAGALTALTSLEVSCNAPVPLLAGCARSLRELDVRCEFGLEPWLPSLRDDLPALGPLSSLTRLTLAPDYDEVFDVPVLSAIAAACPNLLSLSFPKWDMTFDLRGLPAAAARANACGDGGGGGAAAGEGGGGGGGLFRRLTNLELRSVNDITFDGCKLLGPVRHAGEENVDPEAANHAQRRAACRRAEAAARLPSVGPLAALAPALRALSVPLPRRRGALDFLASDDPFELGFCLGSFDALPLGFDAPPRAHKLVMLPPAVEWEPPYVRHEDSTLSAEAARRWWGAYENLTLDLPFALDRLICEDLAPLAPKVVSLRLGQWLWPQPPPTYDMPCFGGSGYGRRSRGGGKGDGSGGSKILILALQRLAQDYSALRLFGLNCSHLEGAFFVPKQWLAGVLLPALAPVLKRPVCVELTLGRTALAASGWRHFESLEARHPGVRFVFA